jgi:predicted nucleic acid-binding protein
MLIDASVVLRHVLADDPLLTAEARKILAPVKSGERTATILHAVLAECVYVLESQLAATPARIAHVLTEVLRYPGIIGERLDVAQRGFDLFASTSLSFVDSLILAYAEQDDMEIATFDKKLRKLAAKSRHQKKS